MKKIIATVLAMVMALALCTTAFAASDLDVLYGKDKKAITDGDGGSWSPRLMPAARTATFTKATGW